MGHGRIRKLTTRAIVLAAALMGPLAAITWADAPGILLVHPTSAPNTEAVLLVIAGTDLMETTEARLVREGRPGVDATGMIATPDLILGTFDIADESPGAWDLQVSNPDGTQICRACFTITADPPTAPAPSPVGAGRGNDAVEVTLRGTNFFPGATVTFSHAGITVTGVTAVDTTELLATIDVDDDAAVGLSDITVTNTDGQAASCQDCFRVISAPSITSLLPASLGRGASGQTVSIVGTDFAPGANASFSGGGISVDSLSVVGQSELRVTVSVSSAAVLGPRDLTVTNADGGTTACTGCFSVGVAPTVAAVAPSALGQGGGVQLVTISGAAFGDAPSVDFGEGIVVGAITRTSATQLTASVTVPAAAAPGARTVTVTNPDAGTGACADCFSVTPAPTVSGVVPEARGRGATDHTVTVSGTGFVAGASVAFSGAGIDVRNVAVLGATELLATIDVAPDAPVGLRGMTVGNPDTGTGSCTACFRIDAAPLLTSVEPSAVPQGAMTVLTLGGTGFLSSAAVTVSDPAVEIEQTTVESQTSILVEITVDPSAPLGPLDVAVTNADGSPSTTCAGCLTITTGPVVSGVSPASRGQGAAEQLVMISGSGFAEGAGVAFGPGIVVHSTTWDGPTRLSSSITVSGTALAGPRDVIVTNPSSVPIGCAGCFTINEAPTITGVSPASRGPGVQDQNIVVTGTGFQDGATLSFSGTDVVVDDVTVTGPGELLARIDVAAGAEPGTRDLTVSNPDGGTAATCADCFSIVPGPVVTAVAPASRGQGATAQTVAITGTGFQDGASVSITGDGLIITETVFVDATEMTVLLDVAGDATPGARDVAVTNPDGGTAGTCTGCLTINPAPSLRTASPSVRGQGVTGRTIRLAGSAFQDGATVAFSGTGITVGDTTVVGPSAIDVVIDIAPAARTGKRTITVTNPDGGTPARCSSCFTISAIGRPADFDGDGFADLAVGAPGDPVNGKAGAGAVSVLYGAAPSLEVARNRLWHRDVAGVADAARAGDAFGAAIAYGDFDADGFVDVAIGVPGDTVNGRAAAGSVSVLYGSRGGLTASRNQLWHRDTSGVAGVTRTGARFGAALATGDFDADGFADLAIGVPHGPVGSVSRAGSVTVLRGTASGLKAAGGQLWHREVGGVPGVAGTGDLLGAVVATVDFDGDGYSDLAAGAPGDTLGPRRAAGSANILYGSSTGLTTTRAQFWHRDAPGVRGAGRSGANFGAALATGDVDGDGFADIAIGAPGDPVGKARTAGSITVIHGSATGVSAQRNQVWNRDSGVRGGTGPGDRFGSSVTMGDFNGDGYSDVAIGVPGEDVGRASNAGAVNVLYGSASALGGGVRQLWHRSVNGVLGTAGAGDVLGARLRADDFDGDGRSDLVMSAPRDDVDRRRDAGSVNVLYGAPGKLTASRDQLWHRDVAGLAGAAIARAMFGAL